MEYIFDFKFSKSLLIVIIGLNIFSCTKSSFLTLDKEYRPNSIFPYEEAIVLVPSLADIKILGNDIDNFNKGITIGIWDKNENGKYNDIGIDRIVASLDENMEIKWEVSDNSGLLKKKNILKIDNDYLLVNIFDEDKKIKYKTIKEIDNKLIDVHLVTKIPDIQIKKMNNELLDLKTLVTEDDYILFQFWSTWCQPCIKAMKEINDQQAENLAIVSFLNDNDDIKLASRIIKNNNFNWHFGLSDSKFRRLFNQNGYPYEVLFNPNGDIIETGYISLEKINMHLSTSKN